MQLKFSNLYKYDILHFIYENFLSVYLHILYEFAFKFYRCYSKNLTILYILTFPENSKNTYEIMKKKYS